MASISVLHVMSTLASSSGGTTEVLKSLAYAQAERDLAVTVAVTDRGNPPRERLTASYFRDLYPAVVALKVFPVEFTPLLWSPGMARWLREAVTGFDIVHVHGLYRFPSTYAAYQARRQGVPYIIRPHGSLDPYMHDKSTQGRLHLKRLYERFLDLPNLNAAAAIHYTTEEERERASYLGIRAPSFVVPNGVDWKRYEELPTRGALRARWDVGEAPVVLFLGRLHFKKGLDLLVPAFDAIRRQIPAAHLVIAGPDNDGYGQKVQGWVRQRGLGDRVHFVGPLYGDEVAQAYVDADVFVLPSYTENFGMTVAEAMACGLPVVISDQVNIHDAVAATGAGLVTACDAEEVAHAVEVLLGDPGRRRVMGEAGRRLVQDRYTWPAIVDALTREYEAVIERHPRTARR